MKRIIGLFLAFGLIVNGFAGSANARAHKDKGSKAFQHLKELVGAWEGIYRVGNQDKKAKVEFQVNADGSKVLEHLVLGEDIMDAAYYEKGGKVYYSASNRPELELVDDQLEKLVFILSSDSKIDFKKVHLHALVIAWSDEEENNITEAWEMSRSSYPVYTTKIILTRVNPHPPHKRNGLRL